MTTTEHSVALVTGAGQGIGAAIVRSLANASTTVVATDVLETQVLGVAAELESADGTVYGHTLDVTSGESVGSAIDWTINEFGRLDILVNNAGIGELKPFLEQTESMWRQIYDVNVFGVVRVTQSALPHLIEGGGGSIVNMASTAGIRSNQWSTHYGSSKHAVIGITQSLAKEFAVHEIRVNAVCPSLVLTPLWDERSEELAELTGTDVESIIEERVQKVPLGRPQSPTEIGDLVAFLASSSAKSITGQAISISGGTDV